MSEIRITKDEQNNEIYIYTPFNSEFVSKIKRIGKTKWNPSQKCWIAPLSSIDSVRQIMLDVYKENDIESCEKIDVKVTFLREKGSCCKAYQLLGKSISIAFGRDTGAKVGEDVEIVKGSVYSGGSAKNWCSLVEEGTVAILRNVSKRLYEEELNEVDGFAEMNVEVLDTRINKEILLREKERLLARLAEINKILGE